MSDEHLLIIGIAITLLAFTALIIHVVRAKLKKAQLDAQLTKEYGEKRVLR